MKDRIPLVAPPLVRSVPRFFPRVWCRPPGPLPYGRGSEGRSESRPLESGRDNQASGLVRPASRQETYGDAMHATACTTARRSGEE